MSRKKYYGTKEADSEKKDFFYYSKTIFNGSCVIYTVVVLFLAAVISLMNTGEDEGGVLFFRDLICLYPLSLLIASANCLLSNKKINFWLRLLVHIVLVIGGFGLYLLTVKQYDINSIVTLTPFFMIIYAVIMLAVLVIHNIKNQKERDNSEYYAVYENITQAQKAKQNAVKENNNKKSKDIEK